MYSFIYEDIGRLEVPVNDTISNELNEPVKYISEEFECLVFWKHLLFGNQS